MGRKKAEKEREIAEVAIARRKRNEITNKGKRNLPEAKEDPLLE